MSIQDFLGKMIDIQSNLLEFLDLQDNIDENFSKLYLVLEKYKIQEDIHVFGSFLRLLLKISNNHARGPNFIDKIERILKLFTKEIKEFYSNSEIFHIFKSNKRILLFMIQENLITVDNYIVRKIVSDKYIQAKYHQYFSPEILPFIKEHWFTPMRYDYWYREISEELPENFEFNRKSGQNENYVCQLIRDDSASKFVEFINKNNYPLDSLIDQSIYETNSYLIKNRYHISLIEYAAFFGSIQIFNYLRSGGVKLTPSLWNYAIHSNNPELIHILEENHVEFNNELYKLIESIKCHNNEIMEYINEKYLVHLNDEKNNIFFNSLKYYNFAFIQKELINQSYFYHFCYYDYCFIVKFLMQNSDCDVNKSIIINNCLILFY